MMGEVEKRGRSIGERAVEVAVERLAEEVSEALPGVDVTRERRRVTLSGKRLVTRWLTDRALRWLGGLLR